MTQAPVLLDMIRGLVGTPSVSSTDPALNQGNRAVIDLLAVLKMKAGDLAGMAELDRPKEASLSLVGSVAGIGGGLECAVLVHPLDRVVGLTAFAFQEAVDDVLGVGVFVVHGNQGGDFRPGGHGVCSPKGS